MEKRGGATAQSGNIKGPAKKPYNFFCRSTKWLRCEQEEMTEEEATKYAKEHDLRFEVVRD